MLSNCSKRSAQTLGRISRQISSQRRSVVGYTKTQFALNTGADIPAIGFGTWQDKEAQEDAVAEALSVGYRHIDTARIYGTEPGVARGIKKSGIPRSDIFITTKLWNNSHHPDDVEKACDASLKDLQTDYVDLYLMHWPSPFARGDKLMPKKDDKMVPGDSDYVDTYKAMEKLVASGKCRAIGISNFSKAELERLLKETSIVPAAHQLEMHPYLGQPDFVAFHQSKGIHITQYSPFGNSNEIYDKGKNMGKLIDDPVLKDIGRKYGKSGAQVALAWGIAKGHSVIPKSKTPSRIKANFEGDFKLDPEDVKKVDALDKKMRFNDPSESFRWNFYADLDGKK
ncbi:hypothetical protein, variant [Phialophora macrospora]|uniref:D-xylose reductase [NAD(P)H] n=1 Tax=Phialophora macrospora TaxID=1851006 RepID=A0A0D2CQY1_9EURO|nr:hypothetical protein PV04_06776 [Phialophora macrospora]KIW67532.1 hypothetical protein, variant [Phialophora macrospora]